MDEDGKLTQFYFHGCALTQRRFCTLPGINRMALADNGLTGDAYQRLCIAFARYDTEQVIVLWLESQHVGHIIAIGHPSEDGVSVAVNDWQLSADYMDWMTDPELGWAFGIVDRIVLRK